MITNERQYQISKAQVSKFRAAIDAPDSSSHSRIDVRAPRPRITSPP